MGAVNDQARQDMADDRYVCSARGLDLRVSPPAMPLLWRETKPLPGNGQETGAIRNALCALGRLSRGRPLVPMTVAHNSLMPPSRPYESAFIEGFQKN